jgi:uncharacterized repeat protein (TIGR04076 family)
MFKERGLEMTTTGSAIVPQFVEAQPRSPRPSVHTPHLPTGNVTLLLADIEGSTRIWETRPREMAAALAVMDRVLAEAVDANNGVCPIEQGEGDSFVVAFSRASDAVACALALHHAVPSLIRLRIGIHTGEVQLRDQGKYMGPTINRTARLRELGHGGQTLLSGTTRDLVIGSLPQYAWLIDLGRHALRDMASPERVAQLSHRHLRNVFPPLRIRSTESVHGQPNIARADPNRLHCNGFNAPRQPSAPRGAVIHADRFFGAVKSRLSPA